MAATTERDVRSRAGPRAVPLEAHLFVVLEGARPAAGGMRCALRGVREVTLARGEGRCVDRSGGRMTITLVDTRVSMRHARLVFEQEHWFVEDCGSTNGTYLNGKPVTRRPLDDGDVIEVGRAVLRIRLAIPTPEGSPPVATTDDGARGTLGIATLLPALASDFALLGRVAGENVPVLLLGDTGTGKEITARAVHAASGRQGELVAVNCAALAEGLVESQLFGHTRGAFSGAIRDEIGFVRRAHLGTLFLDEIGDLPRSAQGALLRVLQEAEVVPVGATRPVAVQTRVIAATHQPIETMVEVGDFRRDLFARLQGFTHRHWPLRERREDIGGIVAHWLSHQPPDRARTVRIAPDAARALVQHSWPMNIRELVQVLARAWALSQGDTIDVTNLPPGIVTAAGTVSEAQGGRADGTERGVREVSPPGLSAKDAALRAELVANMARERGNVSAVARHMHKAPMQVYRWLQRLGIDPKTFR